MGCQDSKHIVNIGYNLKKGKTDIHVMVIYVYITVVYITKVGIPWLPTYAHLGYQHMNTLVTDCTVCPHFDAKLCIVVCFIFYNAQFIDVF